MSRPLNAPPPPYSAVTTSAPESFLTQPEIPSPLGDGLTSPGTAVRHSAKIPSGSSIVSMKNADANANLDHLTFREKMKFFEQEIKEHAVEPVTKPPAKRFSYLAEHEIAKMKMEEANKTAHMSSEQLRSYVASGVGDIRPDQDLDHVLSGLNAKSDNGAVRTRKAENRLQQGRLPSQDGDLGSSVDPRELEAQKRAAWRKARMKSLETDAVHAQAVIAKAQELSRGPSHNAPGTVDIAFADDDDHHQNHNGNSQLGHRSVNPGSQTHSTLVIESLPPVRARSEHVQVLEENVRTETQEFFDEHTGKTEFRTVEIKEKLVERETH